MLERTEFLTGDEVEKLKNGLFYLDSEVSAELAIASVIEWATTIRMNQAMLEMVLEGDLFPEVKSDGQVRISLTKER